MTTVLFQRDSRDVVPGWDSFRRGNDRRHKYKGRPPVLSRTVKHEDSHVSLYTDTNGERRNDGEGVQVSEVPGSTGGVHSRCSKTEFQR